MTTVEQTERTEIARSASDLEIEVHNRRDSRGSRRSVANALAGISLSLSCAGVAVGVDGLFDRQTKNVPAAEVVGGVMLVAGLAGAATGLRRANRYGIEINRLTIQDNTILDKLRVERENKDRAAKATVPSASK